MGRLKYEQLNKMEKVWKRPDLVKQLDFKKKLMKSLYRGPCAICGRDYEVGEAIWYDGSKPPGRKAAHSVCWEPRKYV